MLKIVLAYIIGLGLATVLIRANCDDQVVLSVIFCGLPSVSLAVPVQYFMRLKLFQHNHRAVLVRHVLEKTMCTDIRIGPYRQAPVQRIIFGM